VGDIINGIGFRPFWPRLSGPGIQPQGGSISLKFSVETRLKYESFEPLIDFLAFPVQRYGQKKYIWVKNTQKDFLLKFWLFYQNF